MKEGAHGGLPPILFTAFLLLVNHYRCGWAGLSEASRVCTAASASDSVWPHIVFGWSAPSKNSTFFSFSFYPPWCFNRHNMAQQAPIERD